MAVSPFVLFGHARSGSTILAQVFDAHPRLRVLIEPFAENFHLWSPENKDYLSEIEDSVSLEEQLIEIFDEYDGIKVIGWPLALDLNEHMLRRVRQKVIFMRRRNLLRAAISTAISHRINVWEKRNLPANADHLYGNLDAIPLHELSDWMERVGKDMNHLEAIIDAQGADNVKKITYEELYDSPLEIQETMVRALFDFIGVPPMFTRPMQELLDRRASQMNSEATYRLVPNHEQIELKLGCRDSGFLFR